MADCYLQFSQTIEGLSDIEQQWVRKVLEAHGDEWPPDLAALGLRAERLEPDDWPGFQWELRKPSGDLWLYADEFGNIAHVGEFARAFLHHFRPAARFALTWSETCSRLRDGEFGGGGMMVTADAVHTWSAHEWLAQQL